MKPEAGIQRAPFHVKAARLLVFVGAVSGCAGKYQHVPLEAVVAQPKESDCDFVVYEAPPEAPYDALGIIAPADIESGSLDEDVEDFRDFASKSVCSSGGDALVAERDGEGRYVRGTIIKFK
ncbi:MAG TPA: hypothetical protein VGG33_20315 [Polyangia bacterium]